eukprot:Skav218863  [mRNA]  locus=scaffold2417:125648:126784:+ [translate_table: standard]
MNRASVLGAPAKTSSEGEKKSCKHHFVVHIGPPKSGSTAVQEFLFQKGAWLQESFGIFTGNLKLAKAPFAIIRVVQGNKDKGVVHRAEKILEDVNSRLGKQDVVLSSEHFVRFQSSHWEKFKARLADSGRCMRMVMVHRRESDRTFSQWNQRNKMKKFPDSFGLSYLRYSDSKFNPDYNIRLWHSLSSAAPAGVVGVSYEYLKESNYSFAAFLICNATLHREGTSWKQCVASIAREEDSFRSVTNVSPPPAAIDVVRLAYSLQSQGGRRCSSRLKISSSVKQVALQMPTTCGNIDAQYKHVEDEWFKKSSALRPVRTPSKDTCFVDESRLNRSHWKLIKKVVPRCRALDRRVATAARKNIEVVLVCVLDYHLRILWRH